MREPDSILTSKRGIELPSGPRKRAPLTVGGKRRIKKNKTKKRVRK
jgi:hypothetical protein